MNKNEISDAVNKVKEFVTGVSNNDIILALHSYDFDVEKTIHAFCEEGASGVLDEWVRPAGSSNKKNKNKKKKAENSTPAPSAPAKAPAKTPSQPSVTSVPSASPAPVAAAPVTKTSAPKPVPTNNRVPEKAAVPSASPVGVHEAFQALRNAITEREKTLLESSNKNSSFIGDVNQLIAQIRNFGAIRDPSQSVNGKPQQQQKAASPVQTSGIKHATSQSSLSSSVGADSGVNLSPTHQEDKKNSKNSKMAQVAAGGIQMSSDALSEDQLAAIQRSLQESLAARGIDASVLSGLTNGDLPARKQPQRKPQERKGGQQKEGKSSNRPQLSILNNA